MSRTRLSRKLSGSEPKVPSSYSYQWQEAWPSRDDASTGNAHLTFEGPATLFLTLRCRVQRFDDTADNISRDYCNFIERPFGIFLRIQHLIRQKLFVAQPDLSICCHRSRRRCRLFERHSVVGVGVVGAAPCLILLRRSLLLLGCQIYVAFRRCLTHGTLRGEHSNRVRVPTGPAPSLWAGAGRKRFDGRSSVIRITFL